MQAETIVGVLKKVHKNGLENVGIHKKSWAREQIIANSTCKMFKAVVVPLRIFVTYLGIHLPSICIVK